MENDNSFGDVSDEGFKLAFIQTEEIDKRLTNWKRN